MDAHEPGDPVQFLNCMHPFHLICLANLMQACSPDSLRCPQCKSDQPPSLCRQIQADAATRLTGEEATKVGSACSAAAETSAVAASAETRAVADTSAVAGSAAPETNAEEIVEDSEVDEVAAEAAAGQPLQWKKHAVAWVRPKGKAKGKVKAAGKCKAEASPKSRARRASKPAPAGDGATDQSSAASEVIVLVPAANGAILPQVPHLPCADGVLLLLRRHMQQGSRATCF
jgi:hypothetical protein